MAATGKLEGYFRDIKRWDGAVIGTAYEQATDEVEMNIIEVSDKLVVEITMVNFKEAPYSFFEMFGIKNYKIVDANGKVIVENENLEIRKIKTNAIATKVKLADIKHNSNEARSLGSNLTKEQLLYWKEKYAKAKEILLQ